MSERKYTDEEIIRALECCFVNCICTECPYQDAERCGEASVTDAIDLINRQKAEIAVLTTAVDNSTKEFLKLHDEYQDQNAEIERLTIELDAMRGAANSYKMCYEKAKAEAIKEFAERLKQWQYESSDWSHGEHPYVVEVNEIDNLVAEMTEGE